MCCLALAGAMDRKIAQAANDMGEFSFAPFGFPAYATLHAGSL
jgi:hypothetical protein